MTKEELKLLKIKRKSEELCIHCGIPLYESSLINRGTCYWCDKIGKLANNEGGWRWKLTREILDNYGYRCVCCGETNPFFLTVDHKFGEGNIHRKEVRKSSNDWYKAVVAEGFPDTYQILCFNCNLGRQRNDGVCPHKENDVQENIMVIWS